MSARRARGWRWGQRGVQWALILVALVLLIVLIRGWQLGGREGAVEIPGPLARGAGASIVVLELRQEGRVLRLEREARAWGIVEPLEDLASAHMVRELLRAMEQLEVRRVLETDQLAPYELDPPRARVWMQQANGAQREVRIGATAPATGDVYATWEGLGGAAIIPRFLVTRFFLSELLFWREREVLPPAREAIDSVWVDLPAERLCLIRPGQERWRFRVPGDREADALSCERAVAGFWRFPFVGFYDDPATWPLLGLDPPRATWTVFRGGRIDTIRVGERVDEEHMAVQLAGRPPGRVRADLYRFLTGGLAQLEVRRPLRGESAAIDRVLVAGRSGGLLLRRHGDAWQAAWLDGDRIRSGEAGPEVALDTTGVAWKDYPEPALDADLRNLFALSGTAWLAPAEAPPDPQSYPLRLVLWERQGGEHWVSFAPRDAQGGAGVMSEEAFSGLAVGSRFPERPLQVSSEVVTRWWLRLARRAVDAPAGAH